MEHGRFPYSAIIDRPPLRWPNDAHVALWIVPNVEHFRYETTFPDGNAKTGPDVIAYSKRDYGNRVGIWRLMKLLDRYKIRATVALNADICDYEPRIVEEGNRRGWEWMSHGMTNSVRLPELSDEDGRRMIEDSLAKIEAASGHRVRGWMGPGLAQTNRTLDYLKGAGLDYVADWLNDDQPYMMQTEHGPLCSLSYNDDLDDKGVYERIGAMPWDMRDMIKDQFDVLYREGEQSGVVMTIAVHPYLSGVPHRIKYLDEALAYINSHDHIWWATGGEIVDAFLAQRHAG
jgi:peptidoglycan/xylan/chitin deacetylase (PgdA/CDA1 family)